MDTTLALLAGFGLLLVVGSLVLQWTAWRSLTEDEKTEQRAIRKSDREIYKQTRAHKRRVAAAEKQIANAGLSPRRAEYGQLSLYDDHVRVGTSEYPLTTRSKAKVVGHGRGDDRQVMVLLEDTTWGQSLSATRTGKPNELPAQKFASELRTRAAHSPQAQSQRRRAIDLAERNAAATRGDTTALDAAQATRDALGERHRAAGPPPPRSYWRPGVAAVAVLLFLSSLGSTADTPPAPVAKAEQNVGAVAPTDRESTTSRTELRAQARTQVATGSYVKALAVVEDLDAADRSYVRRLISARAARVADRALTRSDRRAARQALLAAERVDAPRTEAIKAAEQRYAEAVQVASDRRRAQEQARAARRPTTPA